MGVKTQQMVQYSCMLAVTLVSTASQCRHTLPRRAYLERDESAVCTGCMPADVCASTETPTNLTQPEARKPGDVSNLFTI